jgi:hypothetical protein
MQYYRHGRFGVTCSGSKSNPSKHEAGSVLIAGLAYSFPLNSETITFAPKRLDYTESRPRREKKLSDMVTMWPI